MKALVASFAAQSPAAPATVPTTAKAVPLASVSRVLAVPVVVTRPLVADTVPVGWTRSSVPPALRLSAPTLSKSGFAVALAARTMLLAPVPIVAPLKRCELVLVAMPVNVSAPPPSTVCAFDAVLPPSTSAELLLVLLRMLIWFAANARFRLLATRKPVELPIATVVVPE